MTHKLVLASASPRRQELLRQLTDDFIICPADADETLPKNLPPEQQIETLALRKAEDVFAKMISNCEEAKARNAFVAAVLSEKAAVKESFFDAVLRVPETNETTFPLLANIQLQLLAYYVADALGREVDQPRNLAKSVTVE